MVCPVISTLPCAAMLGDPLASWPPPGEAAPAGDGVFFANLHSCLDLLKMFGKKWRLINRQQGWHWGGTLRFP